MVRDLPLEVVKVVPQDRISIRRLVRIIESSVAWFGREIVEVVHIISAGLVKVMSQELISECIWVRIEDDFAPWRSLSGEDEENQASSGEKWSCEFFTFVLALQSLLRRI